MQDECENDDYVVSLLAGLSPLMHWQWIIGTHVPAQSGRKQNFEVAALNLLYGPALRSVSVVFLGISPMTCGGKSLWDQSRSATAGGLYNCRQ